MIYSPLLSLSFASDTFFFQRDANFAVYSSIVRTPNDHQDQRYDTAAMRRWFMLNSQWQLVRASSNLFPKKVGFVAFSLNKPIDKFILF